MRIEKAIDRVDEADQMMNVDTTSLDARSAELIPWSAVFPGKQRFAFRTTSAIYSTPPEPAGIFSPTGSFGID